METKIGKIKKGLKGIKQNVSLLNYTTFRIGGKAKYFFIADKKEDLIRSVLMAKKINLPFFILGQGSNLLVSDKGYNGLVIKIENKKYKIKNNKIITEAGMPFAPLVSLAKTNNLTGLEWGIGIPGTVGGAVYGNAGAFKKSISDNVTQVEVFDSNTKKTKIFKNKECKFKYRESIFKNKKNLIILSAEFKFKKNNQREIQKLIQKYLNYKKSKQPLNYPSAGSIFKNTPNFSAGELIERSGLMGKKIGGAQISKKHANFIINLGNVHPVRNTISNGAKAKDVFKLIKLIKKQVKKKFKINLEEEIQYLGF